MKLWELVRDTQWPLVVDALVKFYPDNRGDLDAFEQVYSELKTLSPTPSPFKLVLSHVKGDDGVLWYEVSGVLDDELYSLAILPWEEWLGTEVHPDILTLCDKHEFVAHCLWEMTYYGFDQSTIQARFN